MSTTSAAAQTPVMQQYLRAKQEHPDALLFFRMGDFYELFFEDAVEAAELLELSLTSRNKNDPDPIPMCGLPYHAVKGYVQRAIEAGRKVAICEQVEDPAVAKGIVRREVTRVVTPGVWLDEEGLDARAPNYLMALIEGLEGIGLAFADVTTGELRGALATDIGALEAELARIEPREVLLLPDAAPHLTALVRRQPRAFVSTVEPPKDESSSLLPELPRSLHAAATALLAYLRATFPAAAATLAPLVPYEIRDTMVLEESTQANLELTRTIVGGHRKGSLLALLDGTATAMGARLLRQWLQFPLVSVQRIDERLDAVAALREDSITREELRGLLRGVYDLERLAGRVVAGVAGPRDLAALRTSLGQLPAILGHVRSLPGARLGDLADHTDPLDDVHAELTDWLAESPPATTKDGGVIREGAHAEVDELWDLSRHGKDWILAYEAQEKAKTGIPSLKVKYNRVFGYYIEITRANLQSVPDRYLRKQTLANAERYYTPELKEYEDKVLSADERRITLEIQLFDELRSRVAAQGARIRESAQRIAELDVFCALAETAQRRRWVRPTLDTSRRLSIKGGRHPVVEALLTEAAFVPNDVELDWAETQLLIVTGPNMAGKSTVMRQVALIVLLAQMGSFVPADEAHVGLVDRIFTRVGAADNLTRGQSTFMVEMTETAAILKKATDRSLIILDEIGRGTSTYDGLSIAWSVAEHLCDKIAARTMFATHYHELTELVRTRDKVKNVQIAVKEWNDDIVFLHKLVDGSTGRSYGIQVGRLAGLPPSVIQRAKEILAGLESGHLTVEVLQPKTRRKDPGLQLSLFEPRPAPSPVEDELRRLQLDALTPIEALNLLFKLRGMLK
ncbi:MAG: DNA mismatch repair protein MutS [Myxococcales bacterium]